MMTEENKKKLHEILKLCMQINEMQETFLAEFQLMPSIGMVSIYIREADKGYEGAERIVGYTDMELGGYTTDEVIYRLKEIMSLLSESTSDRILNDFFKGKEVNKDENRI